MQTIYYETSSFISHQGNVVDFSDYRAKLTAVSGEHFTPPLAESAPDPLHRVDLVLVEPAPSRDALRRRRRRRRAVAFWLEVCASGGVLLFTIAAAVQFLRLV